MARKPPARLRLSRTDERLDVSIYNDSNGFALWAAGKDGKPVPELAQGDARTADGLRRLARQGVVVPLQLAQDDGFTTRFLLGEADPQEAGEWVGRCVARLILPEGRLGYNGAVLEVPPGEYRAEVCCYLPHSNGYFCLEWARKSTRDKEALGAYWRRTRPGPDMPRWLAWHLLNCPRDDPGQAAQWERLGEMTPRGRALRDEWEAQADPLGQEDGGYVDFLVRLTPAPRRLPLPAVSRYECCTA
jgi:hypothetical protein